ncbi:MAG: helix-turn-helix domain-containing protein [Gammaproteobacteria bacterium]
MPAIGRRCHELRIVDVRGTRRIVFRIDADAIVIVEVFAKKTQKTPEAAYIELRLKIAEGLKARRSAKGLTQTDLAKAVRSSQSRVAKMEAGDPTVSLDLLVKSLLALGASSRELAQIIARLAAHLRYR